MSSKKKQSPSQLNREIEKIDRGILSALTRRAQLARQLAEARKKRGDAGFDPYGEWAHLDDLAERNEGLLPDETVRAVFREIISGCRALASPIRVAYLGPPHSYSYLATVERFGQSAELVPVETIGAVFDEVNDGLSDYGLVPIENSTDGRIADTLARFARMPVRICAEVPLRIHHCLLARCRRDEIREVYSKPQALSQCRDWLSTHLPQARLIEIASTTAAAQLAAEREGVAAVASQQAGVAYQLDCVAANIEDNQNNLTRFAVIGGSPARRTGNDKTALMFEIAHEPGSLATTMAIFKRNDLNLTWIESFPMRGKRLEYLFFVELEGHQEDAPVKKAILSLEKKTTRLEILGSYAKTEPVG